VDKFEKIMGGLVIFALILMIQPLVTQKWHKETTQHEIYYATLPFGFIYLEGDMGGWFLGFSGQLGVTENYNIKYMDNGQLKTLVFKAEETPLIIDGTFQVERTVYWKTYYIFFWRCHDQAPWLTEYKIHIPCLPEVNQTLTETWVR